MNVKLHEKKHGDTVSESDFSGITAKCWGWKTKQLSQKAWDSHTHARSKGNPKSNPMRRSFIVPAPHIESACLVE
eukprot:994617-Amphidinium_carterae.1